MSKVVGHNPPQQLRWQPDAKYGDDHVATLLVPGLSLLPPEMREKMLDLDGPYLEYIVDSFELMKMAGCDVTDQVVQGIAFEAGYRRASSIYDDSDETCKRRRREFDERVAINCARRDRELAKQEADCRVYYARIGNRVKIGFSLDVNKRMTGLQPEELLVTEPGGPMKEGERHEQFSDLRTRGEWFRYEGALIDHVLALQSSAK